MMAKVITFSNQKGGVAKTTSSVMTAAGLVNRGYSVLLIDLDPQRSATAYVTDNFKTAAGTIYDIIVGNCSVEDAIEVKTDFGDLIPSSQEMYDPEVLQTNPFGIKDIVEKVREKYDFIIIDTPPTLSLLQLAALVATDFVVIPTKATKESIRGVGDLVQTIEENREYNPKIQVLGFLVVMSNRRVRAVKKITEQLEEYAENIGSKVFKSQIRTGEGIFGEAEIFHDNIFIMKKSNNATKDYERFIDELLAEVL